LISQFIFAQQAKKFENPLKKGWTVYLGTDSSVSIRTIGLVQLQARFLQLNPGSKSIDGTTKTTTTDLSITRVCIGSLLTYKRLTMFYLLGDNGNSVSNGKLGNFYTYEVYSHYALIPKYLSLGMGQTLYNGISRMSSLSISQIITVESCALAIPTAGKSDNIGRQFQIFAIGKIAKFDYRMALVRPMLQVGAGTQNLPDLVALKPINTSYDFPSDRFGAEGYVCKQFFEEESNLLSSRSFSYLGSKKIFNIGAGFEYQPKASAYLNENRDTIFNNTLTFSADCYADIPLSSGSVFTAYGAFYKYNYGKNYLKIGGTMNYFTGGDSPQGAGNNEYNIGTGNAVFFQAAYLFAKSITKENHRLQVYTYLYYKDFEALNEKSWQPGCGINYYILGQNAKIGIQYYRRNVYGNDLKISSTKNNILLQWQVSF
jgi:hypothetical protein